MEKNPRKLCKCLILKLRIHRAIVVKTSESLHVFIVVIGLIQHLVVFTRRYSFSVILDDVIDNVDSKALVNVPFAYGVLTDLNLNRRTSFAVLGNPRFGIVFRILLYPFFLNSVTASKNEDHYSNGATCDQKENLWP